jgi:hypothetical protein
MMISLEPYEIIAILIAGGIYGAICGFLGGIYVGGVEDWVTNEYKK